MGGNPAPPARARCGSAAAAAEPAAAGAAAGGAAAKLAIKKPPAPNISWEQVLQVLERGVSCEEAAKALGCGSTYFKQALRRYRLRVWPYRNVASVDAALKDHAARLRASSPAMAQVVRREMGVLQQWRIDLLADPRKHIVGRSVCVPQEAARIIKAGHKRAHKKFNRAAGTLAGLAALAAPS